jgi:hypothetical protein
MTRFGIVLFPAFCALILIVIALAVIVESRIKSDPIVVDSSELARLAHASYAARQRRIRHDPTAPDRLQEVVLADDAIAVLHQINQEVEHLRFERDQLAATPEFAPVEVKHVIAEAKLQIGSSRAILTGPF